MKRLILLIVTPAFAAAAILALLDRSAGEPVSQPANGAATQPASRPATLPARKTIDVGTLEQLVEAIGPDRIIRLAAGAYDIGKAKPMAGKHARLAIRKPAGIELVISDVRNLRIEGAGPAKVQLLTGNRLATVLTLNDFADAELVNLVIGHMPVAQGGDASAVLIQRAKNVRFENCELFGGTVGLEVIGAESLTFVESTIDHCSDGIVSLRDCSEVLFEDSTFHDNYTSFGFAIESCRNVRMQDCSIVGNTVTDRALFSLCAQSRVEVTDSQIRGAYRSLQSGGVIFQRCVIAGQFGPVRP